MAADSTALRKRLGTQLRTLRLARHWSQEELGTRAGLSYKFVGEVERGVANPTVSTLLDLAMALNVELGALFAEARSEPATYALSREQMLTMREARDSIDGLLQQFGQGGPSRPYRGKRRQR